MSKSRMRYGIVLWLIQDSGPTRFQLPVQGVHIGYKDVHCTLPGLPFSVIRGLEMNEHAVPLNACVYYAMGNLLDF